MKYTPAIAKELAEHVGCGDFDAMVGCPLCGGIRAALHQLERDAPILEQIRAWTGSEYLAFSVDRSDQYIDGYTEAVRDLTKILKGPETS